VRTVPRDPAGRPPGQPPDPPAIPALILAGGRSARMGQPKALLTARSGRTFVGGLVATLCDAGLWQVVVVTGPHDRAIRASLARAGLPVEVVHNPASDEGQLSSLVVGLDAVECPGTAAVLVALVDHPLVSAGTVRRLLDVYDRTRAPVVRPARGERHGHPVIFDRTLFAALKQASGPGGAKPIVRALGSRIENVPVDDDGAFLDIDTPEDYRSAFGREPSPMHVDGKSPGR